MNSQIYNKDEMMMFYFAGYKIAHLSWNPSTFIVHSKNGIINYSNLSDTDLLNFMENNYSNWIILDKDSVILN